MTPLGWRLSAPQWDLLTGALQLEGYPAPIQVPSHGRTALERARIREQVRGELSQLGLMRAGRVDAELEAALRLLSRSGGWLDSAWLPHPTAEQPVRVLAARNGTVGVCAQQHPDNLGATILDVIPAAGLVAAVVSRLPAHPPGRSPAVTVSLAPSPDPPAQQSGGVLVAALPTRTSLELDTTAASEILGQPHTRTGQIVANVRDCAGRVRRSQVLRWCDNPDGRYQITLTARSGTVRSLTVTPTDPDRLGATFDRMLTTLGSDAAG